MYTRAPIAKDQYWELYHLNKEKLVVHMSFTDIGGSLARPFGGEAFTEWGFPSEELPRLGMRETWDVDGLDLSVRHNVQTVYWLCVPKFDTDF